MKKQEKMKLWLRELELLSMNQAQLIVNARAIVAIENHLHEIKVLAMIYEKNSVYSSLIFFNDY